MFSIYWLIIIVQRMGHLLGGMVMFCCTVHSDTITVGSTLLSRQWSPCSTFNGVLCAEVHKRPLHFWLCRWTVGMWVVSAVVIVGQIWQLLIKKKKKKKVDKLWENDEWCIKCQSIEDLLKHEAFMLHDINRYFPNFDKVNHNHNQNLTFSQTIVNVFGLFFVLVWVLSFPLLYLWNYSQQIKRTPKGEPNNSPTVHTNRDECSNFRRPWCFMSIENCWC